MLSDGAHFLTMVNSSATPIDFDTYSVLRLLEWDTRTTSAGVMQVMGSWEVLKRGIDVRLASFAT